MSGLIARIPPKPNEHYTSVGADCAVVGFAETEGKGRVMATVVVRADIWKNSTTPFVVNKLNTREMVCVPGGPFIMGEDKPVNDVTTTGYAGRPYPYEAVAPRRTVSIAGFWIDKYEITVKDYRAFCIATRRAMVTKNPVILYGGYESSPFKDADWNTPGLQDYPIFNVRWVDAKAYADWAGVTLPTEEQWEKAARGTDGRNFPWGGYSLEVYPIDGWDSNKCCCGYFNCPTTIAVKPVGSFPEDTSVFGVRDMAGSVSEWCVDSWDPRAYRGPYISANGVTHTNTEQTPVGCMYSDTMDVTGTAADRVVRGGAWQAGWPYIECGTGYDFSYLCCTRRPGNADSKWIQDTIGFRCVANAP